MSSPYYNDDFHRSCAEEENSPWHSMPYDYPYHLYAPSGAHAPGESSSTAPRFPDTFSPSYNYADSPDMFFDEFEAGSPLSPSSSTSSSSSSCSDAPITPYYQGTGSLPLPAAALLYTKLDTPAGAGGGYYGNGSGGSPDAYCCDAYYEEGWEEDSEMTMTHKYKYDCAALSACQHLEYDAAAATQWACEEAVAHFRRLDASPASASASAASAPPPQPYTTHPYPYPPPPPLSVSAATVTSSSPCSSSSAAAAASPVRTQAQAQEYPGPMYHNPPVSCLSPALLQSCPPPPPLKLQLHQPQPRRSIPVVSLAVLASASSSSSSDGEPTFATESDASPALSPLELRLQLRFPAAPVRVDDDARMTSHGQYSYSGPGAADTAPMAIPIAAAAPAQAYPGSQAHRCPCPECTRADAY